MSIKDCRRRLPFARPALAPTGFRTHRLEGDMGTERERAFAEKWKRHNNGPHPILLNLLDEEANITERDAKVAASIIQWLGTNVGMSFLEEVFKSKPDVFKGWLERFAEPK